MSCAGCSPLRGGDASYSAVDPSYDQIRAQASDEGPGPSFQWSDLSPSKLSGNFMKAIGRGPDETKARRTYEAGDADYQTALSAEGSARRAAFEQAAEKYAGAAKAWPNTSLEEDALFRAGESWFFADHFAEARTVFDELIKKYPKTHYLEVVDSRRLALAQYWLDLDKKNSYWMLAPNFTDRRRPRTDTFGHAVKVLERIRLDNPMGDLADDATMIEANAHREAHHYSRADELYTDLRKNFPRSPHLFESYLLSIKCKKRLYDGPDYEGQSIDDAEQLIKQAWKLFPERCRQEREYLDKTYEQILAQKALRLRQRAAYYDRRKEYGGARYYYGLIREEFPGTSYAQKAQERLAELGDRPDVPPDRFSWLTSLFEEEQKRNQPLIADGRLNLKRR